MTEFVFTSPIPASAADLADWHFRPGAFERLSAPWQRVALLSQDLPLADGARAYDVDDLLRHLVLPAANAKTAMGRVVRPVGPDPSHRVRGPIAESWQPLSISLCQRWGNRPPGRAEQSRAQGSTRRAASNGKLRKVDIPTRFPAR